LSGSRRRVDEPDARYLIEDVPADASEELAATCLAASAAIRLDRNVAFSHSVCLQTTRLAVRFDPIKGTPPRLVVPFEVTVDGVSTEGVIWLWTADPLTLALDHAAPSKEAAVWASVLLGFADLTVWPELEGPQRTSAPKRTRQSRRLSSTEPRERRLPRTKQRTQHMRARGLSWEALRPHLVVGHRRWLPDGWDASPQKLREAAAQGISLEPGQTWVREHTRAGHAAAQSPIVIPWELPDVLNSLVGRRDGVRANRLRFKGSAPGRE
jgi:hypothetical protein